MMTKTFREPFADRSDFRFANSFKSRDETVVSVSPDEICTHYVS